MALASKLLALFVVAGTALASTTKPSKMPTDPYQEEKPLSLDFTDHFCHPASQFMRRQAPEDLTKFIGDMFNKLGLSEFDGKLLQVFEYGNMFSGMSISASGLTPDDIRKWPGVEKVYNVRRFRRPTDVEGAVVSPAGLNSQAPALANQTGFSPQISTQIDRLHARGFKGKDMRLCFVEGGAQVDLAIYGDKGCFGKPGCAIEFGHAFTGNEPGSGPQDDPTSNCDVRSTHLIGQVAAPPNAYGFVGAAPEASIGLYRIFPCGGGGATSDVILSAFMRAAQDGCHVISNSLISQVGFNDNDGGADILNMLNEQGHVTISAWGVSGLEGLLKPSAPAASTSGISATSTDVEGLPFSYPLTFENVKGLPIAYVSINPINITKSLDLYFLSTISTTPLSALAQGCGELPSNTPNLADRLVVIFGGNCSIEEKVRNVAKLGAQAALLINDLNFQPAPYVGNLYGPPNTASLTNADGLRLLELYTSNPGGIKVNFNDHTLITGYPNTDSGGEMSFYSSYGPSADLIAVPTISVPGNQIAGVGPNDTIVVENAFSSPIAAAAMTLILQARQGDKLTPDELRNLVTSTAKAVKVNSTGSSLETVVRQGAGLLQAEAAVDAKSLISPSFLRVNDTAHAKLTQTITIRNTNSKSVTYKFDSTAAVTRATYNRGVNLDKIPSLNPDIVSDTASVAFAEDSVTVAAGATVSISATIKPPTSHKAKFPFYSGFIQISASNDQQFSVPFFGLAATMRDAPIIDRSNVWAPTLRDGLPPKLSYPYLLDNTENSTAVHADANKVVVYKRTSGVGFYGRLGQPTQRLRIDVIAADTEIVGNIPTSNNVDAVAANRKKGKITTRAGGQLYSDTPTIGVLYQRDNMPRDPPSANGPLVWNGNAFAPLPNGTSVQVNLTAGAPYRILYRLLQNGADPELAASYDTWVSPPCAFSD